MENFTPALQSTLVGTDVSYRGVVIFHWRSRVASVSSVVLSTADIEREKERMREIGEN